MPSRLRRRARLVLLAAAVVLVWPAALEAGGEAHDAVEALKVLRALTREGPSWPAYRAQVDATRRRVLPWVDEPGGGAAIKLAVAAALDHFIAVDRLWEREVDGGRGEDLRDALPGASCRRLSRPGATATADHVRQALWACASDRIGEAETLLLFR